MTSPDSVAIPINSGIYCRISGIKPSIEPKWQARKIYKAASGQEAIRRFRLFVNRWGDIEPKAAKSFQDDFYHTLNFYDFPKEIRHAISTTNHLERFLEEIRRRIKIQGYFKNKRSLNLWIYGLIKYTDLKPHKTNAT